MESLGDILRRSVSRNMSGSKELTEETFEDSDPGCLVCKDTGWVSRRVKVGHPDFGELFPCVCQQDILEEKKFEGLLQYSNLGPLKNRTFDSLNPIELSSKPGDNNFFSEAVNAAKEFAENPTGWLSFSGPSGSGKTHILAAIANRSIQRGMPALFLFVPDLLDHLRSTFSSNTSISYDELFNQVKNAPLLILDDVDSYTHSPWTTEKLFQLVNHRFNAALPTAMAIVSPLDRLDERLATRLNTKPFSRLYPLATNISSEIKQLGGLSGSLFQQMNFDSFDIHGNGANKEESGSLEIALKAAKSYASDPHGWLLLMGNHGTGKTHLAVAIANELLKVGNLVFFAVVPELLDHLRSAFTPDSRIGYDSRFEEIKTTPLLILDDLGSESSTKWAEEKLYQIIVYRHNRHLPTIITAPADITLRPAVLSRLSDVRVVQSIDLKAPDYRVQRKRNREKDPFRGQ